MFPDRRHPSLKYLCKQRTWPRIRAPAEVCAMRDGPAREGGRDEDEGKGPGSAFGPESVPLATGLVSVVYWVPGPFPGPTPRPARRAAALFGATPSREGGWML